MLLFLLRVQWLKNNSASNFKNVLIQRSIQHLKTKERVADIETIISNVKKKFNKKGIINNLENCSN